MAPPDTSLDLDHPSTRAAHAGLGPYAQRLLERAAGHAHALHADEVAPEHLLTVMLLDEESAAHETILFGFGDPDSLAAEALALSPGILVVGSESSRPFSPAGVRALFRARELAAGAGAAAVSPAAVVAGALEEVDEPLRSELCEAGLVAPSLAGEPRGDAPLETTGALFAHFDAPARRALGLACRIAVRRERAAIAPAHVLEACLEADGALAARAGLAVARLRALCSGRDADDSPPPPRRLPADEALLALLGGLPANAGSLDLLDAYCGRGPEEVAAVFRRNKVSQELVARARGTFRDP